MSVYYKCTRPDGTDFHTGTVDYAAALDSGEPVSVPVPGGAKFVDATFPGPGWLHLATVPTECVGMSWPCRLFEVEPADELGEPGWDRPRSEFKIGAKSVRVLREIDAHTALGAQGGQLAALIERARRLTGDEIGRLGAARAAAWDAAWVAARVAAWAAARVAAWDAAWVAVRGAVRVAAWVAARGAAWDAALGLLCRDLIGQHPGWDQGAYDQLTAPWRQIIGPLHPDDAEEIA